MNIEYVTELRNLRNKLARYEWSLSAPETHCRFFTDDGSRTSEHNLSGEDRARIRTFMSKTEYVGSNISWCESQSMGLAVKGIILRKLDEYIKQQAAKAKAEAEAVLAEIDE